MESVRQSDSDRPIQSLQGKCQENDPGSRQQEDEDKQGPDPISKLLREGDKLTRASHGAVYKRVPNRKGI